MDSEFLVAIAVVTALVLIYLYSPASAPAASVSTSSGYVGSSGTSGSSGAVPKGNLFDTSGTTFADTILELYPSENYTGWNANGMSANGQSMAQGAFSTADTNGTKQVVFMSQKSGIKSWLYKSLKAKPGTILELTSYNSGNTSRAFIVVSQNIPDLPTFLLAQQELCCGNTGIYLQGWEHWDMDFKISVLDVPHFNADKRSRMEDCLHTTQVWGYDAAAGAAHCAWDGVVGDQSNLGNGLQQPSI